MFTSELKPPTTVHIHWMGLRRMFTSTPATPGGPLFQAGMLALTVAYFTETGVREVFAKVQKPEDGASVGWTRRTVLVRHGKKPKKRS